MRAVEEADKFWW